MSEDQNSSKSNGKKRKFHQESENFVRSKKLKTSSSSESKDFDVPMESNPQNKINSNSVIEYRKKLRSSFAEKLNLQIMKDYSNILSTCSARKATKRVSSLKESGIPRKKKKVASSNSTLDFSSIPDDVFLLIFETLGLRYNMSKYNSSHKQDCDDFISSMNCYGLNESDIHSSSTESQEIAFYSGISNESYLNGFRIDKVFLELSKVCNRIKELIEAHHLFLKLNFFEKSKSKKECELLLKSKRKYYALSFSVQEDAQMQCQYLKKFMETERNLEMAEITFDSWNMLEADKVKFCLENFKNIKTLYIDVGSASINKSAEKKDYMIKFPNLKRLVIKGLNESYCNNLADFIDAPNLTSMEVCLTGAILNDDSYSDWVEILPFAQRFSNSLQVFQIYNKEQTTIDDFMYYSSEILIIQNVDNSDYLIEFLRGRLENLKHLDMKNCGDYELNNMILQEAENLEVVGVDLEFYNSVNHNLQLESVRLVEFSENNLGDYSFVLHHMFPNSYILYSSI